MNPFSENPLDDRSSFQRGVVQLYEPLKRHRSPGKTRIRPGQTSAHFPDSVAGIEGFSRPLWGLVPLAAGADDGPVFEGWDDYRTGIENGVDPDHPEYWGDAGDYSQIHVEMAAIGYGLALAPEQLWDPLDEGTRRDLVRWLNQINDADLYDCNWLFFRVIVNLGLRSVGAGHDWELTQETLDRLETFAAEDGWYTDGPREENPCDYYVPWAMQFYGLVYAAIAGEEDPERAQRFRDRAAAFAREHRHWFREDGAAIPHGRSLTYRFAQAAFWGALALADVDIESAGLTWGEVRGLWARNVRWWADQPIFTDGGVLSVGYRYPTLKPSESYNSASSPYWAMKAFAPLALPETHPFWEADEEPLSLPEDTDRVAQPVTKTIVCRDRDADHHYALTAGQESLYLEKYTKFAYSTGFGFGVCSRQPGLGGAGIDSAIAVSEDGRRYRTRRSVDESELREDTLYSRWEPYDDVTVESWVAPAPSSPWHVRVHRLETGRQLRLAEGGFPLDRTGDDDPARHDHRIDDGEAFAVYPGGESGIRDLRSEGGGQSKRGGRDERDGQSGRDGRAVNQDPNTNVCHSRTVVPVLVGEYDPGTHWIASGITAARTAGETGWERAPEATIDGDTVRVTGPAGEELLRCETGSD